MKARVSLINGLSVDVTIKDKSIDSWIKGIVQREPVWINVGDVWIRTSSIVLIEKVKWFKGDSE